MDIIIRNEINNDEAELMKEINSDEAELMKEINDDEAELMKEINNDEVELMKEINDDEKELMKEINDDETELMNEIEHDIRVMSDACTVENEDTLGAINYIIKTEEDTDLSNTDTGLFGGTDCELPIKILNTFSLKHGEDSLKILNTFSLINGEDWNGNKNIVNVSDESKSVESDHNHPSEVTLTLDIEENDVKDDTLPVEIVKEKEIVYGPKTKKAKTFICKQCNKAFTSERFLKRHKLLHHSGVAKEIAAREVNYQCEKCQKRLCSQFRLTKRTVNQTGERQQNCKLCFMKCTVRLTDVLKSTSSSKKNTNETNDGVKSGVAKPKHRPERYCFLCKKMVKGGKLRRHIKRQHRTNREVAEVLKQPVTKQHKFFDTIRRLGIYEFNLGIISENNKKLMRERKPKFEDTVQVCSGCKKFVSNKYFNKHECGAQEKYPIKLQLLQKNKNVLENDLEFSPVLNKLRNGEVGADKQIKKKRPDRYCIYCKKKVKSGKLRLHIKRQHKANAEVAEVLKQPESEQHQFFETKRREGMYEFNLGLISSADNKNLMREKIPNKNEDHVQFCSGCKKFISNYSFYKHKCVSKDRNPINLELLQKNKPTMDNDLEFAAILNQFGDGEVEDLCRADSTIKAVGYRLFYLRRHNKIQRANLCGRVVREMRILAKLFLVFKNLITEEVSVESMFSQKYLSNLREAVNSEKLGRRPVIVNAIILRSIKSLMVHYSVTMQNEKYGELKLFKDEFNHKSPEIISSATQCEMNSEEQSRHSRNSLNELEVEKLKNFISGELVDTVKNFTIEKYRWLQTLIIGRLTLYNARNEEDPSRITCKEFQEAIEDTLLSPHEVEAVSDEAEKYLVGQFHRAYMEGKCNKHVSVLIPNDLIPGLKLLLENREKYGIKKDNLYLFGTKSSRSHTSGWRALSDICREASVDMPVTAYENRHWFSTIYASFDVNPEQKQSFLDQVDHAALINKENLHASQDIRHVKVVERMLDESDSDADEMENKLSVKWSREETENLRTYFKDCIFEIGQSNRGDLPSKEEILKFLDMYKPKSVQGLNREEQYWKTRTKVFNERKTVRLKADNSNSGEHLISVKWSREDTEILRTVFKDFVFENGQSNKGDLPSKEEILKFLDMYKPKSVQGLNREEQYRKTRAKVFNERKTVRLKADLGCNSKRGDETAGNSVTPNASYCTSEV